MAIERDRSRRVGTFLAEAEALSRSGQIRELAKRVDGISVDRQDPTTSVRISIAGGSALFHQGDVSKALGVLHKAAELSKHCPIDVQFAVALALFERGG